MTCGCFHDRLGQERMEGEPVTGYGQNLRPPMRHLHQKEIGELPDLLQDFVFSIVFVVIFLKVMSVEN